MSRVLVVKALNGNWYWTEKKMDFPQPTTTTSFLEGRLGICNGFEFEVKLPVEGAPNTKYHVFVKDYDIVKVERRVVEDDVCSHVEEVESFEFDS